jgi:hypothetical protein
VRRRLVRPRLQQEGGGAGDGAGWVAGLMSALQPACASCRRCGCWCPLLLQLRPRRPGPGPGACLLPQHARRQDAWHGLPLLPQAMTPTAPGSGT